MAFLPGLALPFAHVMQDHAATDRLVAEHFLERGLRHFFFTMILRATPVISEVKPLIELSKMQVTSASVCTGTKGPGIYRVEATGADGNNDYSNTSGECQSRQGFSRRTARSHWKCKNFVRPPASPFLTNWQSGHGRLLDRLMEAKPMPQSPVLISPARTITRKSSDVLAVDHQGAARGLSIIAEHFTKPISINDVARAAGVSRRGLHQAFYQHVGCPRARKFVECAWTWQSGG